MRYALPLLFLLEGHLFLRRFIWKKVVVTVGGGVMPQQTSSSDDAYPVCSTSQQHLLLTCCDALVSQSDQGRLFQA
jgi:hypothetical protein